MKTTATKIFTFDCAHMLSEHNGQCANLHGHTYKLEVTVTREVFPTQGSSAWMIMDFADLKKVVDGYILQLFDHSFVYAVGAIGTEGLIAKTLEKAGLKTVAVPYRTTCENMANFIYNQLEEPLKRRAVQLISVKLWETPTGFAEYRRSIS